jgi:ribonuclease-3
VGAGALKMMVEAGLAELQRTLGHQFAESALLKRALTHRSCLGSSPATSQAPSQVPSASSGEGAVPRVASDNEQFEYLGDAVLGMLVSEYLVRMFPDWTEGQLSKGRARLVNAASLHTAAKRLGLGGYLRLGRGEEKTGGREKPALLADAFEAIVAAIYLDAGLVAAREFVGRALLEAAIVAEGSELGLSDHKSALQELLQARGLGTARYKVVREAGPDHQKTFWVEVSVPDVVAASGCGPNKKEAERSAAQQALEQLRAGTDSGTASETH